MSGSLVAAISLVLFFVGYRYYSKFLAEKIYKLNPNYVTPAHKFEDGVDYVPTNKYILWGHHFTSIAGAAPIVGPAIAVYWGWLPAMLWVVIGTIFAAGVHDFGVMVLSVRNKGQSIGILADKIVGRRAKILFLFIILILVLMVNAVFAWVISNLFISFPASVLSIFIQIPLAVWIGYRSYRKTGSMLIPSIIVLFVMYFAAIIASYVPALQIDFVRYFGGEENTVIMGLNGVEISFLLWIIILMIYVYIASTLSVWKLLQPRDFINSHQLIVGLVILYLGLFVMSPEITAPTTNEAATDVSWFPLLFITIACGAISGFHGLVSSGTTAKQLDKETDARFIGYLGAVGEGALALITIVAVVTYFNTTGEFLDTYHSFASAGSSGLNIFVQGAAQLATALNIPLQAAETIIAVIVISFAATTLDTSVRLMRYIINELGQEYSVKPLTKMHISTSIAVGASAALVLIPEGPRGIGSGGYLLWPLFGTSNQLLAAISLLIVTIWLKRKGRNYIYTLIPLLFLIFMTLWAMIQQVFFDWSGFGATEGNMLLFIFGAIILSFAVWIVLEALFLFRKESDG
ncbi:carbon starvation CstA family protein [Rhodohalobacter sulfatireducens]|uniref:Carbon starvation protein A n=1 Tax=Rhodohalobacter sulfatireducens TaxID=2911366 RepID=A0ABS9KDI2_9BACT|nr:carbon starvation protein A [Rhodohalobacter sulfatireducens]MCG2588911.1 carbon starvation protein A [Rhodohalobacter sulfatireducens]